MISEAFSLLRHNLGMIAAVVLTVWLPGNLLIEYLSYHVFDPDDILMFVRSSMWIEAIFGPIYIGGLLHILAQAKQGEQATYREAINVGIQNWGRLFVARFVAGLIVLLGLVALIVPGVIMALRYAFLDAVVVLEGENSSDARIRSTDLTEGMRWEILGVVILLMLGLWLCSFVVGILVGVVGILVPFVDTFFSAALFDCLLDIVYAIIPITLFLYYWDARRRDTDSPFSAPISPQSSS